MKNNTSIIFGIALIIGDALAITAAFTVAYILRVSINHRRLSTPVHAHTYIMILVSLLPFWILIFTLLGLYNIRMFEKRFSELGRLFVGSFIGILFIISYSYMVNKAIFPARLVTVYSFLLIFFFVISFRTIARGLRRTLFSYGFGINNVLIVGSNKTTNRLIEALSNTKTTGYRVLGVVDSKHLSGDRRYEQFNSFQEATNDLRLQTLHTIIQTHLYTSAEQNNEILTYAQENHIAYRFVPGNSELFVGNLTVDLFHAVPIIAVHQTALVGWGRVVKRLMDIIIGGLFFIIALPFMIIISVIIKLSDGGPIFFRQERLSRFNTPVQVYKFRSLSPAYSGLKPEEAFRKMGRAELIQAYRNGGDHLANDPRLSLIGGFLRRYSLDELPQLWNVVIGQISLVGPRALVPYELEQSKQKNLILSVKSGLTGLAQISGVRDLSFTERRKLDLYYVQNWSLWSDLIILIKTFWVVLFHQGTRG
jgi:exopolysaccharide biosynthesis polyprenyl glycosylphosphotransferase